MRDGPLSFLKSWEGFLPPNAVLMTKRGALAAEKTPTRIRFGFEAPDLADPAAREMLDKILAALGLAADEFAVFANRPAEFESSVLVRFAADAADSSAGAWEGSSLKTYSLTAMLADPGLKKPVWAQLKDAVVRGRREA